MTKTLVGPVISGITYDFKIKARNNAGYESVFSGISQIVIAAKSSGPSAPTSVSATSDPISITIKWTNPDDLDLKGVEIYYATASAGSFNLIGSVDGVPGTVQEFGWNYDVALNLNQTYYLKIRAANTSLQTSAYSAEVSASFSTIDTGEVTMNAISGTYSSIVANAANSESTTQDTISYSSNGTGSDAADLDGYMAATITLGTIDSTVSGFLINANAMASKRTLATATYAYAILVQKLTGNTWWSKAASSGNYSIFLGTEDVTGQDSTYGIQGNYSTSFIDDATGVVSTTGCEYGLFLFETTEVGGQYWIFGGTGLSLTELKR